MLAERDPGLPPDERVVDRMDGGDGDRGVEDEACGEHGSTFAAERAPDIGGRPWTASLILRVRRATYTG